MNFFNEHFKFKASDLNGTDNLVSALETGDYEIGDINTCFRNPDTRFVIFEKYPEKDSGETEYINGVKVITKKLYVNVELVPIKKSISVNIKINKDGTIEYGGV